MLLLGLILLTLGFTTFDFQSTEEGKYSYQNLEQTVPVAAESFSSQRGREFMEKYQFFSINHRQNAVSIEITVVAGFQENQNMKIYTGNFRREPQKVNFTVNGESFSNNLEGDTITSNATEISDNYNITVKGQNFEESFQSSGTEFLIVAYRHSTNNAVRQDTYTS